MQQNSQFSLQNPNLSSKRVYPIAEAGSATTVLPRPTNIDPKKAPSLFIIKEDCSQEEAARYSGTCKRILSMSRVNERRTR
jgi:hypothetical protein